MSNTFKDNKRSLRNKWGRAWWCGQIPSWFKRMNRRIDRTRQERALREGKEIPVIKNRDAYDWW